MTGRRHLLLRPSRSSSPQQAIDGSSAQSLPSVAVSKLVAEHRQRLSESRTMPAKREGLSIVEDMAVAFYAASYRGGKPIVAWSSLNVDDRKRYIDAMEAAVRAIPDRVGLKRGAFAETCLLDQAREFILGEHDAAKKSALYGL